MSEEVVILKIDGDNYVVTAPYTEGHVLTAEEASALNRFRAENVGNAARARQAALSKKEGRKYNKSELQDFISKYAAEYTFGTRSGGTAEQADPVEEITYNLVMEHIVKPYVRGKFATFKEMGGAPELHRITSEYLASDSPKHVARVNFLREEARRQHQKILELSAPAAEAAEAPAEDVDPILSTVQKVTTPTPAPAA